MKKTISLLISLFAVFLSVNNVCESSNLRYQDYLDAPRNNILIMNSPEEDLRTAYNAMRNKLRLDTFETRAEEFEEQIFDPIDMNINNIPDQTEYMNEIIDLKIKLNNINSSMIRSFFSSHRKEFSHRLSLAKLDQQLFNAVGGLNLQGRRGDFNHPSLLNNQVRGVLNNLVGKIFHVYENDNQQQRVRHVGSGMFSNLHLNNPVDLTAGNVFNLNSVITCAHVIEANDDERTIGVYFVPNDVLDQFTGFPQLRPDGNPLINSNDLINYLVNSINSYQISTYITKQRIFGGGIALFPNNNITATNPQYFNNEDIIFGNIQLNVGILQNFRQFNDPNITVSFNTIRNNLALNFNNGDQYFGIGYPGCDHYDLLPFENQNHHNNLLPINPHPQFNLIENRGYSPLMITSSRAYLAFDLNGVLHVSPSFDNGIVRHEAPTAKGMSGGSLVRLSNGGNQIDVFGIISGGSDNSEEGCY